MCGNAYEKEIKRWAGYLLLSILRCRCAAIRWRASLYSKCRPSLRRVGFCSTSPVISISILFPNTWERYNTSTFIHSLCILNSSLSAALQPVQDPGQSHALITLLPFPLALDLCLKNPRNLQIISLFWSGAEFLDLSIFYHSDTHKSSIYQRNLTQQLFLTQTYDS